MVANGGILEKLKLIVKDSPVFLCPCCRKKTEVFPVYFSGNLEAIRCGTCGIAFPK